MSNKLTKKSFIIIFSVVALVFATYIGLSYKKASIIAQQTKEFFARVPNASVGSVDYSFFPSTNVRINGAKISSGLAEISANSINIISGSLFDKAIKIYLKDGVSYKIKNKSGLLTFKKPNNSFITIISSADGTKIQYKDEGLVIANNDQKTTIDSTNKLSVLSSPKSEAQKINLEFSSVGNSTKAGSYKFLTNFNYSANANAKFGSFDIQKVSFSSEKVNISLFGNANINPKNSLVNLELSLLKSDKLFDFIFNNRPEILPNQKEKITLALKDLAAKNQKTKGDDLIFKINGENSKIKVNNINIEEITKSF